MTNRLAYAALLLAACSRSGSGPDLNPLDESTGKLDAAVASVGTDAGSDAQSDARAATPSCQSDEREDLDEDGFTRADGDCNDCNAQMNPGAFDYPNDSLDDDCSGSAARSGDAPCDQGLAIGSTDAKDAARAIGLCSFTSADSKAWGVVRARFTDANGTGSITNPLAAGLLPNFGAANPGQGKALLALSSGVARAPDQPGYTATCDLFGASCEPFDDCIGGGEPPDGYPKESSSCRRTGSLFAPDTEIFNQAALELTIRVPRNASSLSFDTIFYSSEYPNYICSKFNDFFVVFKEPKPSGVADGNIVFDANDDPIGVNTGLLAVCDPTIQIADAKKEFDCAGGTDLLKGTGYGANESDCEGAGTKGGAATGWLHTTAPVEGGEQITLRFAIWDTNDPDLDSTVLIDNFRWAQDDKGVGTTPIPVVF